MDNGESDEQRIWDVRKVGIQGDVEEAKNDSHLLFVGVESYFLSHPFMGMPYISLLNEFAVTQ